MAERRGTVRRAYESAYPAPFRGAAGDTLTLEDRETEYPGWFWAIHGSGAAGWVPDTLIARQGNQITLRADYDATELTVAVNEPLTVLEQHGGWYRCRTSEAVEGWVPMENVALAAEGFSRAYTPHPLPVQQQVRAALLESSEAYRALVDQSVQGLFIAKGFPPKIVFANRTFEHITGYSFEALHRMRYEEIVTIIHPDDIEIAFGHYQQRLAGDPVPDRLEYRAIHRDGRVIWVEEYVTRIVLEGQPAVMAAIMDVTDRKRAEQERERLITDLKRALTEVKTLRGILPICGQCKKIRDDQGYWKQVEQYLQEQSDAEVSHGLCPDCVKELYPEFHKRRSGKT